MWTRLLVCPQADDDDDDGDGDVTDDDVDGVMGQYRALPGLSLSGHGAIADQKKKKGHEVPARVKCV